MPKAPRMNRSRTQLGTSYAPGSFFTFEGGRGACISRPVTCKTTDADGNVQRQIHDQMRHFIQSWYDRARSCRTSPSIEPRLCIEGNLVDGHGNLQVTMDKFTYYDPSAMGYIPEPLTFICRHCSLLKTIPNPEKIDREIKGLQKLEKCPGRDHGTGHEWEQLDVIWVHWSGEYEPISPAKYVWAGNGVQIRDQCKYCGNKEFRLLRNSPFIGQWEFQCIKCQNRRGMIQRDRFTYQLIGKEISEGTDGHILGEVAMEAISYRASAAYYVQADRIIEFRDNSYIDLLNPTKKQPLITKLSQQYNLPGKILTDAEKEQRLREVGLKAEWISYINMRQLYESAKDDGRDKDAVTFEPALRIFEDKWHREVFRDAAVGTADLTRQVEMRPDYARRYDPIRLAIEHRTLQEQKLDPAIDGRNGRKVCVDVTRPDEHLILSENPAEREQIISDTKKLLPILGIAEMKMIREFDICEFSFGYTRVEAKPSTKRHNMEMPVRLRMFPKINGKHPIYVVRQANEAFYVRLNENVVLHWLGANKLQVTLPEGMRLGGHLIEIYEDFGMFLEEYRGERVTNRTAFNYVYSLLHTYAHHILQVMSHLSGLDQGSFGEHLFPADLSFVVYRKGTTMDLGNLSAMWRNHNTNVLRNLIDPKTLRCGSGSLCSKRGGACPDCLMIPETSCIAGNNLLSRSMLIGQGNPHWDTDDSLITGYFEIVQQINTHRSAS